MYSSKKLKENILFTIFANFYVIIIIIWERAVIFLTNFCKTNYIDITNL